MSNMNSLRALKIISILIGLAAFGYVLLGVLGFMFTLGFTSTNPHVWEKGTLLFQLLGLGQLVLIVSIIKAKTLNQVLIILVIILGISASFYWFAHNAGSLWRKEAAVRGIELLPETSTWAYRSKHCKWVPAKDNLCTGNSVGTYVPNPNYFECEDTSANFCGKQI